MSYTDTCPLLSQLWADENAVDGYIAGLPKTVVLVPQPTLDDLRVSDIALARTKAKAVADMVFVNNLGSISAAGGWWKIATACGVSVDDAKQIVREVHARKAETESVDE